MTLSNFRTIFNEALTSKFPKSEIDSFFFMLIEHQFGFQVIDFFTKQEETINHDDLTNMQKVLDRLTKEEPIQYILGTTNFYGLNFNVTPATLIPRPETEELVSWVLTTLNQQHFKHTPSPKILDIGTGSGCIAITLKHKHPAALVKAIDISKEALSVASKNADSNNDVVSFTRLDILNTTTLNDNFDIIVSNPPYVRELEKKQMQNNVLQHEPKTALFVSDENPLIFYDKIADIANVNLNKDGFLFFEINQYLGDQTKQLLQQKGFKNVELKNDLFGKPRMIKAQLKQ